MTLQQQIKNITHDALIWLGVKAWKTATDAITQDGATKEIIDLLLAVPNQVRRDAYIKSLCEAIMELVASQKYETAQLQKGIRDREKAMGKLKDAELVTEANEWIAEANARLEHLKRYAIAELTPKILTRYIKDEQDEREKAKREKQRTVFDPHGDHDANAEWDDEEDPWLKCPKWMSADDVKKYGFTFVHEVKGGELKRHGYYSYNPKEKSHTELTNFQITPIFHIRSGTDSRHLIEVDNGYKKAVMDVESKLMVSPDLMLQKCVGEGNFVILANKLQFLRISMKLLQEFRECLEVKSLGWQHYGFYAFVNGIFIPGEGFKQLDEWGVIDVEQKNFLIPAASAVYRTTVSTEDDPYENDRPLEYVPAKVSFDMWVDKIQEVFMEKGLTGAAYAILSSFRDIAFAIDNNFPHLYAFGEKSSGKSAWAQSVSNFFYKHRAPFQLPSGTDYAFFRYMGNFKNAVAFLNEFDEKTTKPEWFQAIKGVFDGEGRQRGSMTNRGKTETMKVDCGLVLAGQYLVTQDDNSVVTRSIIESFSERQLTNDERALFTELREMEEEGLTGLLCELLSHRKYFKDEYRNIFTETVKTWKSQYNGGATFNQRLMQNWAHLYTAMYLAKQKIYMPSVNIDTFKKYCFDKASYWCKFIRSSDTLSEFWNTLMFLAESKQITMGWDVRVETVMHVTIRKSRDETYKKEFMEPTKILYLRLNNIHKTYEQTYRSRTGKQGMSMENLLHYFSSRSYYVGPIHNVKWGRKVQGEHRVEEKVTNGYAFLYDELELDLETESQLMGTNAPAPNYFENAEKEDVFK